MNKLITSEIIVAYSQCPRKAFLLIANEKGTPNEYMQILEEETKKNRESYFEGIKNKNPNVVLYSPDGLKRGSPVMFVVSLEAEDLLAYADVLTPLKNTSSQRMYNYFPTLIVGLHKINKQQKLQLAFAGYVLSKHQKEKPVSGTIIAIGGKPHKIKLDTLYREIEQTLGVLRRWLASKELESPAVIMNKHCPYCPFQKQCEVMAKESDHLSLLGGIGKKEIEKYNKKGLFTVKQLSYTFRPKKMKKKKENYVKPHSFSLQALAIREQQIYVYETPKIPKSKVEIFLDIEGIPDEEFQYLIGLLIKEDNQVNYHFFWANSKDEELIIFQALLHLLDRYDKFTLFHYGTYETNYLKRISKQLSEHEHEKTEKILQSCCNILSFLYTNIYFPTYTNGLKDIGKAIGFSWSDPLSSGLQSIVWRKIWELAQHDEWRNKLIRYNKEDCLALLKIKSLIDSIIENEGSESRTSLSHKIVYTEELKRNSQFAFLDNNFALPEIALINRCSYFDYQQERVHARTGNVRKRYNRKKTQPRKIKNRVNKVIEITATVCPKCGSSDIGKRSDITRNVIDLKFFESGAKRWIIKYISSEYVCCKCHHKHIPKEYLKKYRQYHGHNLKCWTIFQHIVNKESFRQIKSNCLELFNINLTGSTAHDFKKYIAEYYECTYDKLLQRILNSHVVYVDETPFNLLHETVYAWVFTNGYEVVSLYKPTREGEFLKELFQDFKGVIVSDYFAAYDSIDSPQQKCLIHLMRDFNSDLLKNPFDNELKYITQQFTILLQDIVKTIDKYGLRKRYLNKHKKGVKTFFKNVLKKEYQSEVAQQYQQRLQKNENKLFTFLNYDDVGWNNTNAEHAIKLIATHRNMNIKFFRSSRMEDYLKIMSLYQTCEYRGISFLQFMLSQEVDFDKFLHNH